MCKSLQAMTFHSASCTIVQQTVSECPNSLACKTGQPLQPAVQNHMTVVKVYLHDGLGSKQTLSSVLSQHTRDHGSFQCSACKKLAVPVENQMSRIEAWVSAPHVLMPMLVRERVSKFTFYMRSKRMCILLDLLQWTLSAMTHG